MKLLEMIVLTASYYSKTISEPLLKMYVEDLSDLSETEAIEAYRAYRKNPKNKTFPLPAQILEIARPQISDHSIAVEASSQIIFAINKFGWARSNEAKTFLGERAWLAVERSGGWQYLCENVGVTIQPGAFVAQSRELIKSKIEIDRVGLCGISKELPYRVEPLNLENEKQKQFLKLAEQQKENAQEKLSTEDREKYVDNFLLNLRNEKRIET